MEKETEVMTVPSITTRRPSRTLSALVGIYTLFLSGALAAQEAQPWMHTDVAGAWASGFTGKGVTISVIDDFAGSTTYASTMTGTTERKTHGGWTQTQVGMIATGATVATYDFNAGSQAVQLGAGLNVLNLSYGKHTGKTVKLARVGWSAQDLSVIDAAKKGTAVVIKSAGNDGIAVGAATRAGTIDQLNAALIGTQGTIFVGALESHGSPTARARIAAYSNRAGTNKTVQNQFLVVGVPSGAMGLQGTSFAAPVVAGYAAIIGEKFKTATPVKIRNQLLNTARRDTIAGYNVTIHGRGEASLSRALAPVSIK